MVDTQLQRDDDDDDDKTPETTPLQLSKMELFHTSNLLRFAERRIKNRDTGIHRDALLELHDALEDWLRMVVNAACIATVERGKLIRNAYFKETITLEAVRRGLEWVAPEYIPDSDDSDEEQEEDGNGTPRSPGTPAATPRSRKIAIPRFRRRSKFPLSEEFIIDSDSGGDEAVKQIIPDPDAQS
ncbi:hypothetical protein HK104_002543 [Borealophlyctis nickersoniae]|nr:hypothetical protein HK104_002543 [Borealophlyctis nickersoniae]